MADDHPRNTRAMNAAPRCGALTRRGSACGSPAMAGKARCRIHRGKSPGAPPGNSNALKNGLYTREFKEKKQAVRAFLAEARGPLVRRSGP